MTSKLTLVVALYVHEGREAQFEQFEAAAAEIMLRYGGTIERRIGCATQAGEDGPHEIHVVTFPDEAAFEQYSGDADLNALAELRSSAIRETTVWRGTDLPAFVSSPLSS